VVHRGHDQPLIQLDDVDGDGDGDGERLQLAQRRVTGAELVDSVDSSSRRVGCNPLQCNAGSTSSISDADGAARR
jgi:hypothetical protein